MNLLNESGLSLERLAGFLEVADRGSITAAAQGDSSRQALLSRQIKELEIFFAVKLTRRAGRGIELTDAGRDLERRTREAFRSWEEYKDGHAGKKRKLKIGASNSVLEWKLIPVLHHLAKEAFELGVVGERTAELVRMLEDGALDFAILRDDVLTARMHGESIGSYGYKLWIPRKLIPSGSKPNLKLLATLPLALSSGGTFRQKVLAVAARHGIDLNIAIETTAFAQALEAVRTKHYAAILPEFADTGLNPQQFLAVKLPELKEANRKIVLARRKQRDDLKKIERVLLRRLGGEG